jgi:hypothetical protein
MDREKLIEQYAQIDVDGWDMDTLYEFAIDKVEERLKTLSDEELIDEINEYFPYILEND